MKWVVGKWLNVRDVNSVTDSEICLSVYLCVCRSFFMSVLFVNVSAHTACLCRAELLVGLSETCTDIVDLFCFACCAAVSCMIRILQRRFRAGFSTHTCSKKQMLWIQQCSDVCWSLMMLRFIWTVIALNMRRKWLDGVMHTSPLSFTSNQNNPALEFTLVPYYSLHTTPATYTPCALYLREKQTIYLLLQSIISYTVC